MTIKDYVLSYRFAKIYRLLIVTVTSCLWLGVFAHNVFADPFEIVVGGLSVNESKPNGAPWDLGFGAMSRPDLVIEIKLSDRLLFTTPKTANAHSAAQVFRSSAFELNAVQSLIINVIDKDLKADDLIDRFEITVTPDDVIAHRRFELSGKSVIKLSLQVTPPTNLEHGPPQRNVFVPPLLKRDSAGSSMPRSP